MSFFLFFLFWFGNRRRLLFILRFCWLLWLSYCDFSIHSTWISDYLLFKIYNILNNIKWFPMCKLNYFFIRMMIFHFICTTRPTTKNEIFRINICCFSKFFINLFYHSWRSYNYKIIRTILRNPCRCTFNSLKNLNCGTN
jgi:hypothetical protein